MLLRNFDFATKYFDYQSNIEIENNSNPKVNGWYKFINRTFSALLVVDNNLYFIYGERKFLIMNSHRILLNRRGDIESEFILMDNDNMCVAFIYSTPESNLNALPFEYIDDDDFKWGDFVAKIINDEERKKNFVANLMECRIG